MVDCHATLPDIHLQFDGGEIVVLGSKMKSDTPCPDQSCDPKLVVANTGEASYLGTPMFISGFVVFDQAGSRVGFASKKVPDA